MAANISQEIATVRSGIWGRDVRDALADALDKLAGDISPDTPGTSAGADVIRVDLYYLRHSSATSVTADTAGWQMATPTLSASYPYLWALFKLVKSDGTEVPAGPVCIGTYHERLSSVSVYTMLSASTSTPSASASGWSTAAKTPTASQPYLYAHIRMTYYAAGSASTHTINGGVFRLATYTAPAASSGGTAGPWQYLGGCGASMEVTEGMDVPEDVTEIMIAWSGTIDGKISIKPYESNGGLTPAATDYYVDSTSGVIRLHRLDATAAPSAMPYKTGWMLETPKSAGMLTEISIGYLEITSPSYTHVQVFGR